MSDGVAPREPDGRIYRREGRALLVFRNGNFFTVSGWPWPFVMLDEHVAEGEVSVEDYYGLGEG